MEPLPESTESTALKGGYSGLKWILWRISLTFETLWSLPKSRFFAKNRFNSKFQIKMFGVRAFSIKRAFLSNFSQKFSPKFRSVWPYRQSLAHPNWEVSGLIGSQVSSLIGSPLRYQIKTELFTFVQLWRFPSPAWLRHFRGGDLCTSAGGAVAAARGRLFVAQPLLSGSRDLSLRFPTSS